MSLVSETIQLGDARKKPHHLEVTEAFLSKFRKESKDLEDSLERETMSPPRGQSK